MTDEAFLRAIAESPRDDTHRLVYADWLEERGDPRAEWLRLQQTLASLVPDRAMHADLCAREQELHRALDPVWLHAVRRYTTPPPCRDIAKLVPALAPFARTTTRLHPRRAPAPLPAWQSKVGGLFLWPESEPWPECPECHVPLTPVIQLRASDVPLLAFPPGRDLLQLFWCPNEGSHNFRLTPVTFLRASADVRSRRTIPPDLARFSGSSDLVPCECLIYPEPVIEYPDREEVERQLVDVREEDLERQLDLIDFGAAEDLAQRLAEDEELRSPVELIDAELRYCPGVKAGGLRGFTEDGRLYEHLLSFPTCEYYSRDFRRWMPIEEQRLIAPPGEPLSLARFLEVSGKFACHDPTGMRFGRSQRCFVYVWRDKLPWDVFAGISD